MFVCYTCKLSVTDYKEHIRHIQVAHSRQKSYCCGFELCYRSYFSFSSLKNHIVSKHKTLRDSQNISNNSVESVGNVPSSFVVDSEKEKIIKNHDDFKVQSGISNIDKSNNVDEVIVNTPLMLQSSEVDPILVFCSKLYDYPDVCRARASEIINEAANVCNILIDKLRKNILETLNDVDETSHTIKKIETVFKEYEDPFKNFKTEHRLFTTFQEKGTYIPAESYLLGEKEDYRLRNDTQRLEMRPVTAEFIKIRTVLTSFFQMPFIFDKTMKYNSLLQKTSQIISNFIQGELWSNLSINDGEKIVFPLEIYQDDYENNNVLGSHRGVSKCSALYVRILCLPPDLASKLENIFLFVLFNTLDRHYFNNKVIYSKMKEELIYLEKEGININVSGGIRTIFFRLSLISGDNLGLHYMLGFRECFNKDKFCRFCLISKKNINKVFNEYQCVLRDANDYESDVNRADKERLGIAGECLFYKINGFHPLKNLYVDIVHDVLEGICRYDLGLILHFFIEIKKYFDLKQFNTRVKGFNYGFVKNKPPEILNSQLKNKKIIMSASEVLAFVRHLPFIIGHNIPENDEVWKLLISLRQLIDMLFSYEIPRNAYVIVDKHITDYLKLLNSIFPDVLKPKHHFLVHYGRVLFLCGPLMKIYTIRCEAKHREAKITSHSAMSRVNICKTIATKHQLRLNYSFLNGSICSEGNYDETTIVEKKLLDLNGIFDNEDSALFDKASLLSTVQTVKRIKFNGNDIRIRSIIMIPNVSGPSFYEVEGIVLSEAHNFILITKQFYDLFLEEHTESFQVCSQRYSRSKLKKECLEGSTITYAVRTPKGKFIVENWW